MSNSAAFTIAYDGPALDNHEMDAKDLGLALLSICALIESSSKEIYGKDCKTNVKIKAGFKPGSFEIDFGIAQSHLQNLLGLMNSNSINGALNLITVIGFGGSGAVGLMQVLKFLGGKKPDRVVRLPDQTIQFFINNTFIIGLKDTDTLYKSLDVRREFKKVMSPLENDGIDSFEVRKLGNIFDRVSKKELPYFYDPSLTDEIKDETLIRENLIKKTFSIASLDFKPGNKWRLSDGTSQFHVEILDKDFLKNISVNRVAFCKDDLLITDLKISEYETPKGLRTDYQIIKVLEHRQASKQLELPYDD